MAICNLDQLLADACDNKFTCINPGSSDETAVRLQFLCDLIAAIESGGGGGSPAAPDTSIQFNDGGSFGGDADLTWNKTTNLLAIAGRQTITPAANTVPLTISGYSLTGSNAQSLLSLAGTWNTTGTPTGINLNITDTASGASSLLMDLSVGGTSRFSVSKNGKIEFRGSGVSSDIANDAVGRVILNSSSANGVRVGGDLQILTTDLTATRDAAGVWAQRNGTSAQTFRWYRTFTDASNYERGALQTAAGQVILAAETAGTGTDDIDVTLTPAGVGLLNVTTAASADAAVVSTHTARVKFNGTEYKVLLATP